MIRKQLQDPVLVREERRLATLAGPEEHAQGHGHDPDHPHHIVIVSGSRIDQLPSELGSGARPHQGHGAAHIGIEQSQRDAPVAGGAPDHSSSQRSR